MPANPPLRIVGPADPTVHHPFVPDPEPTVDQCQDCGMPLRNRAHYAQDDGQVFLILDRSTQASPFGVKLETLRQFPRNDALLAHCTSVLRNQEGC